MPGNEVGDRVHNFFDQGSLSQDQRHTQFVAANWPGYYNNIWNVNERHIGGPVNTGLENYSPQQSDIERGQGNQFSLGPNGQNFARQNLRPEFVKNSSQLPQLNLNGFMHASQIGPTRHNEAKYLGVDTQPDRYNLTSRSPVLEAEQSGSQLTNSANFGGTESPMNFNIFSGQHQMNSQQPGMMQSLPRQQPAINNTHLQQQFILKQMELQRQHQLQQFEVIQKSAANHVPPFPNQTAGQHPPAINGNPLRDASNYPWPSQVTASNTNWQQRGMSASVPGYSKGFMISPEQGQAMQFMGLIPQHNSQSLYGVPVSGSRSYTALSHSNIDRPGMLQVSAPSSSFSCNQYGALAEQVSVKEGNNMVSRFGSEGNTSFGQASSQRIGNMVNLGGFAQGLHRNVSMSEGGGQGFCGGSEFVTEKSLSQGSSQGASTQAPVGLDPTEEKILFGNDDNIWEAFSGAALTGSGDAPDLLSGFPSMQSGTWSALMQSAVAETSSTDGGMQEEWSGLGSPNSRPQSDSHHPSVSHSNEKPQLNLVDSSQRASLGSQLNSNDMNIHTANVNNVNSSGYEQQFLNQRRDNLQAESHTAQEGKSWWDCLQQKPHAAEKLVVGNFISSRDFSRTASGFWGQEQSSFLHNNAQKSSQPSSSNFIGSVPANGGIALTKQDNLFDKDRVMQMQMDTGNGSMRLEPVTDSNIKMESSHASSKDNALAPGLRNMKVDLESSQKFGNNHNLDLEKSMYSSGKSGFEGSRRDTHNLNKVPIILESLDNSQDARVSEMHETENGDMRESSSDSHRGGFPPNALVGSSKGNMWLDSADRCSLPVSKEMPSGQPGKRGHITRKFQYHPMGDVDANLDSSYPAKQVFHSQSMSQLFSAGDKVRETNQRFHGTLSTNTTDMEGPVSNNHGSVNFSRGIPGATRPGHFPDMSAAFVHSGEISSPNQYLSLSHNMLELLHKVDQSKEQNAASHFSSADYSMLSDMPVGGVAEPSQSHLSTSHGFSLQLAPPSQVISHPNLSDGVQSSSRTIGSPSTDHVVSEKEDKHAWLASLSSAQCLQPQQPQKDSVTEPTRSRNMDADVSVPNLKDNPSISSLKSPFQSEYSAAPAGKIIGDQSPSIAFDRQGYHDEQLNASQPQAKLHPIPDSFHAVTAGMSRKSNLSHLGNLRASQRLLGAQACNAPELLKYQFQSPNASETSFIQHMKDEQDVPKRVDALNYYSIVGGENTKTAETRSSVEVSGNSQDEPCARHLPDASASSPTINQKNNKSFQRVENHNNTGLDNYSLMPQMQTMKNLGSDPSQRESKRLKGQDDGHDQKQIAGQVAAPIAGSISMASDPSMSHTSVAAGDAKMLNFSPQLGNRNTFQLPHGAVTSQDMLSFGCNDPQKFAIGNVTCRTESTGISPQMAPSWFKQYGTLKNGQLLPGHNVSRVPMMNVEQQLMSGNTLNNMVAHNSVQLAAAATEAGQIANSCQTANAYTPIDHISSLHALVPHVSAHSPVSMRPQKRKTATSDLLPWNKEIGPCLRRLQNLSSAEVNWAQSSNRLIEKVEDEIDNNEDLLPMTRPRRRLLLTTQLMQQMLQSPSATVLSLDVSSDCEVIVYSLARSVLGDACSLICGVERNSHIESANLLSWKVKTSERIQDQYFSKVVEDFVSREKELENELLRLDKRASILDFRLDCQDLERFSVINRFARFHGRGQADGAETSASSDTNATVLKPCPQRYVSAHPMPRNVPETVLYPLTYGMTLHIILNHTNEGQEEHGQ